MEQWDLTTCSLWQTNVRKSEARVHTVPYVNCLLSFLQELCRTMLLLSLPFTGGQLLLSWPHKVLRAITWGEVAQSMISTHLLRQFSIWSYYFLTFHDSQASQCYLNQPSINIILHPHLSLFPEPSFPKLLPFIPIPVFSVSIWVYFQASFQDTQSYLHQKMPFFLKSLCGINFK